jgi:hypothetical protein
LLVTWLKIWGNGKGGVETPKDNINPTAALKDSESEQERIIHSTLGSSVYNTLSTVSENDVEAHTSLHSVQKRCDKIITTTTIVMGFE